MLSEEEMEIFWKQASESVRNAQRNRSRMDLVELKSVIERGDYSVPAIEIAKKMLGTAVFQCEEHG